LRLRALVGEVPIVLLLRFGYPLDRLIWCGDGPTLRRKSIDGRVDVAALGFQDPSQVVTKGAESLLSGESLEFPFRYLGRVDAGFDALLAVAVR
jgi:hypothetical protein